MKRLLLLIFMLVLLGAGAMMLTRALGSARPLDPDSFAAILTRDVQWKEGMWCWKEICPSRTSYDQLWDNISKQSAGDMRTLVNSLGTQIFSWKISSETDWQVIFLLSDESVVQQLRIIPADSDHNLMLTMGDLINVLGLPTSVRGETEGYLHIFYTCFHTNICVVTFSNPKRHDRIYAETTINQIFLGNKAFTASMINSSYFVAYRWKGFGTYPVRRLNP